MNNNESKKAFLGFSLGVLLFYIAYRAFSIVEEDDVMPVQPKITEENVNTAVKAFVAALNDGADRDKLNELNKEFAKQFGVRLILVENNKIAVNDLSGKRIKTVS